MGMQGLVACLAISHESRREWSKETRFFSFKYLKESSRQDIHAKTIHFSVTIRIRLLPVELGPLLG